jgi:hypothetical protein
MPAGFIDSFIFGYVIMLVSLFYQDNIQNISRIRQVAQYIQNVRVALMVMLTHG